jgi:hypothetical protein
MMNNVGNIVMSSGSDARDVIRSDKDRYECYECNECNVEEELSSLIILHSVFSVQCSVFSVWRGDSYSVCVHTGK